MWERPEVQQLLEEGRSDELTNNKKHSTGLTAGVADEEVYSGDSRPISEETSGAGVTAGVVSDTGGQNDSQAIEKIELESPGEEKEAKMANSGDSRLMGEETNGAGVTAGIANDTGGQSESFSTKAKKKNKRMTVSGAIFAILSSLLMLI